MTGHRQLVRRHPTRTDTDTPLRGVLLSGVRPSPSGPLSFLGQQREREPVRVHGNGRVFARAGGGHGSVSVARMLYPLVIMLEPSSQALLALCCVHVAFVVRLHHVRRDGAQAL